MKVRIKDFLAEVKTQGVQVGFEEGKLKIKAAKGAMTPEIMAELKEKKPALLAYFEEGAGKMYDLSFSQERLWFLDQYEENSNTYHMPGLLKFKGDLDREILRKTLKMIIKRHEVLRTNFVTEGDKTVQIVKSSDEVQIKEVDLADQSLDLLISEELQRAFNLETDDLLRIILYTKDTNEAYLFVNMHHIITDGWSISILIEELVTFYSSYKRGLEDPMSALPIQYGDYAVWQKEYLSGEMLQEKVAYWRKELEGVEPLALPTSYQRPTKQSYQGKKISFHISKNLTDSINQLSKKNDVTLFMTLLSAFSLLLSKYSNQEDVVVGIPIANRERAELEQLIGFFVNTLAIRQNVKGDLSFTEFIKETKETTLNAYEHQDVPFEKIVDVLNIPRDQSRSPLFQVMFVLQNTPEFSMQLPDVEMRFEERHNDVAKFDLTMTLSEEADGISASLEYATDLFSKNYVANLVKHFTALLEQLVIMPEKQLSKVNILSSEEEQGILEMMQGPKVAYDKTATIHSFFESQAEKTPENVAVIYEDEALSYAALNAKANQLAHYLVAQGVKADDLIAISLDRSFDMIISLLAVLKAGAAYVPVDPSYPQERIDYIIADSKASFVLNTESLDQIDVRGYASDNPETETTSENLAYVIYTSGSTGNPKGVMLTHQGVVNLNEWYSQSFDFNEQSANLIIISFGFDAVQKNIFSVLKTGGKIILPRSEHYNPDYLSSLIEKHGCTHLNCVPSAFYPLMETSENYDKIRSLKYVLVGGEATKKENITDWYQSVDTKFVNIYGPTECNDITLAYLLSKEDDAATIPVGTPVYNAQVYIVDKEMNLVAQGVSGELCIAGDGLSKGYLYQPEMTSEKFIENPFSAAEKVYRTGDLVKMLEDGNIEYLGRIDEQVKIRGFRIELGEIEQQLLKLDTIKEAVVLAQEDANGSKNLVAYLVSESGEPLKLTEVKTELLHHLPDFMVPSAIVMLDTMPLTPNDKIDKKALDAMSVVIESSHEYVAARDETEAKLAKIFADVLNVEKVGVYDDFFELGGHSLLATQLVSKVRNVFNVELPLKELFSNANINALKQYLSTSTQTSAMSAIKVLEERENMPLSFSQERLWFVDQLDPGSADYNIPIAITMKGNLDISMVNKALDIMIARHENLRTVFPEKEGVSQQQILEVIDFKLQVIDISDSEKTELNKSAQALAQKEANRPFDLAKGPLLRALIIKLSASEHVMMLNMHHIVSDGWSMGILFQEFDFIMAALSRNEALVLPELRIQYADYAVWQRERLEEGKLEKDLKYWKEALTPYPAKLNTVRLENKALDEDTLQVTRIKRVIDTALVEKINTIAKAHNFTLTQVLLALYSSLIQRYTNQDSMVIAVPNANRPTSETEQIIGFFVNTMLIKLDFEQADSYLDISRQVHEKMLDAIEHQEAPLQHIIESIRSQEGMINIDESTQFAFNSLPINAVPQNENSPLSYDVFDIGTENVKTLLTMTEATGDSETEIQLSYKNSLLEDAKVEGFLNHYFDLLNDFCNDTENLIALAPIFDEEIIEASKYAASEVEKVYPLSQMQEDLYYQGKINFFDEYLIGLFYEVGDDIDIDVMEKSIRHLFSSIDILHARVVEYEGKFYQLAMNTLDDTPILDVIVSAGDDIQKSILKIANAHISFEEGACVKALFVKNNARVTHISYLAHHAMIDGLSMVYLNSLVDKIYKQYRKDQTLLAVDIGTTFSDLKPLISKYRHEQMGYWKEPLSKVSPIPVFSANNPGKQIMIDEPVSKEIMNEMNAIRKAYKVSVFALFNAIYLSVLYRLYGFSDDVVLYEPQSGKKSLKDFSLGVYLDIRPIIVKNEWFKGSVVALAQHIHNYQTSVTERISMRDQTALMPESDISFGMNFVPRFNNTQWFSIDSIADNEVQFTMFSGSTYGVRFTYPENVFNGVNIVEKFFMSMQSVIENRDVSIVEMDFLTKAEQKEQLVTFNSMTQVYDSEATIHQRFESQVKKTPEATAVIFEDESLSYAALNARANQLAHYLLEQGVQKDEIVALCIDRSFEMVIGLLAILKAGGAYVPIDPKYPGDRIAYMVEDSKANIILTKECIRTSLPQSKSTVVSIDTLDTNSYSVENPETGLTSANLAYLIYTSGSTGQPKGVMVEHRGVVNLLQWYRETIGMNDQSSTTIISSLSFDLTQKNIFSVLQAGGKLVLSQDEYFDPSKILQVIEANACTFLNCAPSTFYALVDACAGSFSSLQSLKYLFLGGESISFERLGNWLNETDTTLVNSYGPTESSDVVSFYALEDKSVNPIPIGKPVPNIQLIILDENANLVPKGVPGELHISGDGLARGYLNQPEMTEEKFIDNPFETGTKMYRTGDLVKYIEDGNIEYLGRIDDQVKIHGFRIELGEIEQQLMYLEQIKEAVVLPKEDDNGHTFLAAYVVTENTKSIDLAPLKTALLKQLPDYMVPSAMLTLDAIPLTPNRKVDKKALLKLEVSTASTQEYVAPRDEREEILSQCFAEVLSLPKVGIYDNFFDLGGNSILSVQLVSMVKAAGVAMEVKHIFRAQSVAELSEHLLTESSEEPIDLSVEAVLEEEIKPLGNAGSVNTSKDVLLTGATGFVGRYLLHEIFESSNVDVHCIVRAKTEEEGLARVKNSLLEFQLWDEAYTARLHIILGDLAKENLAIEEGDYAVLCEKIDKIYHSATYMNHLADYEFLKEVNVGGLKSLLKFATTGRDKTLEYISTTDVLNDMTHGPLAEDAPLEAQIHFKSHGYASTKYVAEEICLLAQQRSIDVNIYRLGLITGDVKYGKNDHSQWFHQLLEGSMKLKALFSAKQFQIPITPVDFVARSIVTLGNRAERKRIYHLTNEQSMEPLELLEMYNDTEEKLAYVSLYEFIQRLKAYNAEHEPLAVTTFFDKYLDAGEEVLEALQADTSEGKLVQTAQTMAYLKTLNVPFPTIDKTLIKKYFDASVN